MCWHTPSGPADEHGSECGLGRGARRSAALWLAGVLLAAAGAQGGAGAGEDDQDRASAGAGGSPRSRVGLPPPQLNYSWRLVCAATLSNDPPDTPQPAPVTGSGLGSGSASATRPYCSAEAEQTCTRASDYEYSLTLRGRASSVPPDLGINGLQSYASFEAQGDMRFVLPEFVYSKAIVTATGWGALEVSGHVPREWHRGFYLEGGSITEEWCPVPDSIRGRTMAASASVMASRDGEWVGSSDGVRAAQLEVSVRIVPIVADLHVRRGTVVRGDDLYELVASADQTVADTAQNRQTVVYEVTVENAGLDERAFTVDCVYANWVIPSYWSVRFSVDGDDIGNLYRPSGNSYTTPVLRPGGTTVITVEAIPATANPLEWLPISLWVHSVYPLDPAWKFYHDQVEMDTTGLVVTSAGDQQDASLTDNVADVDLVEPGVQTTLRAALELANARPGRDDIWFNVPESRGGLVIEPRSALPTIVDPVAIDALTQGGGKVQLDGAGQPFDGLVIAAGSSSVRGFIIARFGGHGIVLQNNGGNLIQRNAIGADDAADLGNYGDGVRIEGSPNNTIQDNQISGNDGNGVHLIGSAATGNILRRNMIGTDQRGAAILGNEGSGVRVEDAPNNDIGGMSPAQGNVISGNGEGVTIVSTPEGDAGLNRVRGNCIGTDRTATVALRNLSYGVYVENTSGTTIGGAMPGAGNIISGNLMGGIYLRRTSNRVCTGNWIKGNGIGTDGVGCAAIGNGGPGVWLQDAHDTVVGGPTPEEGNVISGNAHDGLRIRDYMWGEKTTLVHGNVIGANGPPNFRQEARAAPADPMARGMVAVANGWLGVYVDGSRNNVIRDNVISGNVGDGLALLGERATGSVVQGNRIGVTGDGATALGNGGCGLVVSAGGKNTIGGTQSGEGNVISGNAKDGIGFGMAISSPASGGVADKGGNLVQGNRIGTDATGTVALANAGNGISDYSWASLTQPGAGNRIGGPEPGAGNVISGNTLAGLVICGKGARVRGNLIGTNRDGSAALGNRKYGVFVDSSLTKDVTVGGTEAGEGNIISGNGEHGVCILGSPSNPEHRVLGNRVGTDATGTVAIPNGQSGVALLGGGMFGGTTVGGATPGARNLISGNAEHGVLIDTSGENKVQGNWIGTQADSQDPLRNGGHGVFVSGDSSWDNLVGGKEYGEGNLIAFNGGDGVRVNAGGRNGILGNSIHRNEGLGIDLGGDGVTFNDPGDGDRSYYAGGARLVSGNFFQNSPVIESVTGNRGSTTVSLSLNSTANTLFRIEFFGNSTADASGLTEGETFLGHAELRTDATGNATFTGTLPGAPGNLTATATDPSNNTSEFSIPPGTPAPDRDGDGVADHIERFADVTPEPMVPEEIEPPIDMGDVNGDGTADAEQANVASLQDSSGQGWVGIASPSGTRLANVRAVPTPSPGRRTSDGGERAARAPVPSDVAFPLGFFQFTVLQVEPGGATVVELILPAGTTPRGYWKYGPEPGNPTPHLYEFRFDGTTGAELQGNKILLHLVDGQRGDDDLTVDGAIVESGGGPAVAVSPAFVGLNLVGLAVAAGAVAPAALALPADAHLFTWDPACASYRSDAAVGQLLPGQGFWLRTSVATVLYVDGQPATPPFACHLGSGWNLISAPLLAPVPWDGQRLRVRRGVEEKDLTDAGAAGWIHTSVWGWESDPANPDTGRYTLVAVSRDQSGTADRLLPWRGYWVMAWVDCDLLLAPAVE